MWLLAEPDSEKEYLDNIQGVFAMADNALQWKIIRGLEKNLHENLKIISSPPVGTYPKKYKKIYIPSKWWSHGKNCEDIRIGFLNISIIKALFRNVGFSKFLSRAIKNSTHKEKVIISYNTYPSQMIAMKKAKKKFNGIKNVLIVTDLPEYAFVDKNLSIKDRIYKYFKQRTMVNNLKYIDGYVLLTEYMKYKLDIENKPYVVVEGIADIPKHNLNECRRENEKKIILYTGTLRKKYGIMSLLEAFSEIKNPNYMLYICGLGEAENEIIELSKFDSRIVYKGMVSREEAMKLQTEATVLINPRSGDDEFTKYSFPSKTMEYLASGKPTICYKLCGIPSEYDNYLFYIDGNDAGSMKIKIEEVCEMKSDTREKIGLNGKKFVLKEKNEIIQSEKIIKLIEKLGDK